MTEIKKNRKQSGKYEIDMTSGPLFAKLVRYSIPLMLSGILQLLFNAADIVVVGRFEGPEAIAAVGSTASVINLLISLFIGLSVGVNVLTARYFASQQQEDLEDTVHTSVALSLAGGLFIALVGISLTRTILTLMGSPEDVIDLSTVYMRIYFIGMPVTALYNFGASILRAVGDTRRPLYYLTAAGIVNVVLNVLFVAGLHLGVAGVALATILSQTISALLVLRCLMVTDSGYRVRLQRLRISRDKFLRIARIGVPAGLQSMVFSLSNTVVQSSVNSFGSTVMAGNAAASNIENFVFMSMEAYYQACISFASQNFGVGKMKRMNHVLLECLFLVTIVGIIMGWGYWIFGRTLLGIYTDDAMTIEYGMQRAGVIGVTYFTCGIMDVLCGAIRGLGCSMIPMIVSMLGACGFRLLWIATVFQCNHTLHTLYLAYPISWVLTGTVHVICYIVIRRKVMKKIKATD